MKPTHLLLATALLLSSSALAQTVPTTYEFLTVATQESNFGKFSQLTFAPSFQGKTLLQLEELPSAAEKRLLVHQRNLVLVNQQLEALTAAGWELVQAFSSTTGESEREYLFRRRKP